MPKIIIAPDKFRGSLTALEVCKAMQAGILAVIPNADIVMLPMADGGEGTAEILTYHAQGKHYKATVSDPLGRPIKASYGLSADSQTAYIEMATASGLQLLKPTDRNPLLTTTYGTGELIKISTKKGANHIILGIGGSATTDAGIGMAVALGWQFLDNNGKEIAPIGKNMIEVQRIIPPKQPLAITVEVACDVTAPLFGKSGAAYIYAPQKGATPKQVKRLDEGLTHIAEIIKRDFGKDLAHTAGAGAAGGLGFGALFFLNATLKNGIQIVMEQMHFEQHLEEAKLVLTGEGKIDKQTLQGKLVAGIAQKTLERNIPLIAICGALTVTPAEIKEIGVTYATSIIPGPMSLEQSNKEAFQNLKSTTQCIMQLLKEVGFRL